MVFGKISLFQIGSLLPSISGSALCLAGNQPLRNIEIDNVKKRIVSLLETREKVSIYYLSEELDVPPRKIIEAVRSLEEEGILKDA